MHHRPVSWPLVCVGLMGVGIGVIGFMFYLFADAAQPLRVPVASAVMTGIGLVAMAIGWFHDSSH